MSELPGRQPWWKRPLFSRMPRAEKKKRSPQTEFFWKDSWPRLRSLGIIWILVSGVLTFQLGGMIVHGRSTGPELGRVLGFAMNFLPTLGVLVLAVWGMRLGCERGSCFRRRGTVCAASEALSVGELAADRVRLAALGWSIIMLPLGFLVIGFRPGEMSMHMMDADGVRDGLGRSMALGAQAVAGVLPLSLWIRRRTFLGILGGSFTAWGAAFVLGNWIGAEWPDLRRWGVVVFLLALKLALALLGLAWAHRSGHVKGWFIVALLSGWGVMVAGVAWFLQGSVRPWGWHVVCAALFIPLARIAWCPMAVAASRRC